MSGLDLSQFRQQRDMITQQLKTLKNIAEQLNNDLIVSGLESTINELNHEQFRLVVVGEFNRGKSTFINALIGQRLLPSAVKPTTAILNKITYGLEPKFKIVYRDSQKEEQIVDELSFKKIVAPVEPISGEVEAEREYKEALQRINEIAYADIECDSLLCREGIEIVDTPGTNDLDSAREEITYRFIPQADAAIFILSGHKILSESEMQFLRDRILAADIQKIFFIINFKDQLSLADQETVFSYARKHLIESHLADNPKIFFVSAKSALTFRRQQNGENVKGVVGSLEESGFIELEEQLTAFLSKERGRVKLSKPIQRGLRLAKELLHQNIRFEKAKLGADVRVLQQQVSQLKPQLEDLKKVSVECVDLLKRYLQQDGMDISSMLHQRLRLISAEGVRTVTEYTGPLNKEDVASAVEATVAPLQTSLQIDLKNITDKAINNAIAKASKRFEREWGAIEKTILDIVPIETNSLDHLLTLRVHNLNEDESAIKAGLGSLGILGVLTASIGFSIFLVPVAIVGGVLLHSFFENNVRGRVIGQVREEVRRRFEDGIPSAVSSFEKDWKNASEQLANHFFNEVSRKVTVLQKQMDSLLADKQLAEAETAKQKEFLDNLEQDSKTVIQYLQHFGGIKEAQLI